MCFAIVPCFHTVPAYRKLLFKAFFSLSINKQIWAYSFFLKRDSKLFILPYLAFFYTNNPGYSSVSLYRVLPCMCGYTIYDLTSQLWLETWVISNMLLKCCSNSILYMLFCITGVTSVGVITTSQISNQMINMSNILVNTVRFPSKILC